MKKMLMDFIVEKELNPFNNLKSLVRKDGVSIFKTTDAKSVYNKVLSKLSSNFVFSETSNLWNVFSFVEEFSEIKKRQDFFKSLKGGDNKFLRNLVKPRRNWSPRYDIVVVTEDEGTFIELQKLNCPVQILFNENDLVDLARYDVVQVIDCEMFGSVLERLPQSVFVDDLGSVYLERFLEELSGWRENVNVLKKANVSEEISEIVDFLLPLFDLIERRVGNILSVEEAENVLSKINESINEKIGEMTVSGESLVKILSEGELPENFTKMVDEALIESGLPYEIFNFKIPVELDYTELGKCISRQSAVQFTNLAEEIKRRSDDLKIVKKKLDRLMALLILEDFCFGVGKYLEGADFYPIMSSNVHLEESINFFLDRPTPISFQLDSFSRCSILTGANSGGKTTLLEHLLQSISYTIIQFF